MAMEKSLDAAPVGIEEVLDTEEPDLEVELEGSESVDIGIEALEIEVKDEEEDDFDANLAESLNEKALVTIAGDLLGDFEDDISARKDWIQTYVDGLELLGMKIEERTEPWEGACGVYHPLLSGIS